MRASGHVYAVEGWGIGELWLDETGVVLAHDLPAPRDRAHVHGSRRGPGGGPSSPSSPGVPARTARPRLRRGAARPETPLGGSRPPLGTLSAIPSRESADTVPDVCRRFAEHLAGTPASYDDLVVDASWCTPFQGALLEALRGVPWGDVVTYGELAAIAGRPGAARAAGAFCAENRFALVVPCHRVVAATSIGGYGDSGVETKRRLLRLEGVEL